MARRIPSRIAGILITLGILSLSVFATTTPANATDFICPARTVCVFPNDDLTGNYPAPWNGPAELTTDVYNGAWYSFASLSITPNPGSVHDNSGSCLWVFDREHTPHYEYVEPGNTGDLDHGFGYFFIQFGVSPCPASPPAGAP